jgi:DDE_Tnp_1-associated
VGDGMEAFAQCFEGLEDPRTGNAGLHNLHELLMIALCTVLCGGQTAVDMHLFARAKEDFLRGFLKLENGLPSHDTFSRLFRRLDPDQFQACFQQFMARFAQNCKGVIAIDGKVVRRSFDTASAKSPLHMVSAWGCEQHLVLAQIATIPLGCRSIISGPDWPLSQRWSAPANSPTRPRPRPPITCSAPPCLPSASAMQPVPIGAWRIGYIGVSMSS